MVKSSSSECLVQRWLAILNSRTDDVLLVMKKRQRNVVDFCVFCTFSRSYVQKQFEIYHSLRFARTPFHPYKLNWSYKQPTFIIPQCTMWPIAIQSLEKCSRDPICIQLNEALGLKTQNLQIINASSTSDQSAYHRRKSLCFVLLWLICQVFMVGQIMLSPRSLSLAVLLYLGEPS